MDPGPFSHLIPALALALTLTGEPTSIRSLFHGGVELRFAVGGPRQAVAESPAPEAEEIRARLGTLLLQPLRFPEGRARVVTRDEAGDTKEEPAAPEEAPAAIDQEIAEREQGVEPATPVPLRLFGVASPGGVALSWTPSPARGGTGVPPGVRLYRWRRGAIPTPLLEEPLSASAHLDDTAAPGWTYWYAVERLGDDGLGRFALTRVRVPDAVELHVVGGDASGAWIEVVHVADATTTTVFVGLGRPVADAAGTLVTAWRVQEIRETMRRREVERIEPVFRPDGRVALDVGGEAPLQATRTRWLQEPALEVVLENADGERRTLLGPLGAPQTGKG